MQHTYENRIVIWESKIQRLLESAGCLLLAFIAFYFRSHFSPLSLAFSLVLFGGGALLMLYQLLNPKYLFVSKNSKLGRTIIAYQHRKEVERVGIIICDDFGVKFGSVNDTRIIPWDEIQTIFAYKVDLVTTDEICIDVFVDGESPLLLTESVPGWDVFVNRLKTQLPEVQNDWNIAIMNPTFDTKLTLVYDRKKRPRDTVEKECYK